jgi:hypothetical protein
MGLVLNLLVASYKRSQTRRLCPLRGQSRDACHSFFAYFPRLFDNGLAFELKPLRLPWLIEMLRSRCMVCSVLRMVAQREASTIDTGSSAAMRRGRNSKVRATITRWCCPPFNWCGKRPRTDRKNKSPFRAVTPSAHSPAPPPAATPRSHLCTRRPARRGSLAGTPRSTA